MFKPISPRRNLPTAGLVFCTPCSRITTYRCSSSEAKGCRYLQNSAAVYFSLCQLSACRVSRSSSTSSPNERTYVRPVARRRQIHCCCPPNGAVDRISQRWLHKASIHVEPPSLGVSTHPPFFEHDGSSWRHMRRRTGPSSGPTDDGRAAG